MPKALLNVVGPQIRRLRIAKGLTQEELAARIGVAGWRLSRATLSQIEAQIRCVTDVELLVLAKALRLPVQELLPSRIKYEAVVEQFFGGE